jgi:hypothetical protein
VFSFLGVYNLLGQVTNGKDGQVVRLLSKEFNLLPSFPTSINAIISANGDTLIPFSKLTIIDPINGDYYLIHSRYSCVGVMNKYGRMIIPTDYEDFSQGCSAYIPKFHDGIIILNRDRKVVLLDTTGNILPVRQYDGVSDFSNRVAIAYLHGKHGYINLTGDSITPFIYNHADSFIENRALISTDSLFGYLDEKFKIIIPCKYEAAEAFFHGLASVKLNGKYGVIDRKGEIIIPFVYDWRVFFSRNLAIVSLNHMQGVIDSKNKFIIPAKYDEIDDRGFNIYKSPFKVKINMKWGLIDSLGSKVLPLIYDEIGFWGLRNGLVAAKLNDKWGYVDSHNKTVIPFVYDKADDFGDNGFAYVKLKGEVFYIDKLGRKTFTSPY